MLIKCTLNKKLKLKRTILYIQDKYLIQHYTMYDKILLLLRVFEQQVARKSLLQVKFVKNQDLRFLLSTYHRNVVASQNHRIINKYNILWLLIITNNYLILISKLFMK